MSEHKRDRLGIVFSTVTEAPAQELISLAQQAETAGFDAVYVNEGRGDALANLLAIGLNTEHVMLGTNIANIYFRHPYLAAHTAKTIAELTGGRLILGLGMSHRQLLGQLDIDMGNARQRLSDYTTYVKAALRGEAASGFLVPEKSPYEVPVYVAANTVESASVAGSVGDGLMPFLSPRSYLPVLSEAAANARKASNNTAACPLIISIPTFLSDDAEAARSAARYNLAFFANLPNYRRQWRRAGYGEVMNAIKKAIEDGARRRDIAALVPDALIDDVCVYGDAAQCNKQLDAFRQAGADEPVVAVSPVNDQRLPATREAIDALAPPTKA